MHGDGPSSPFRRSWPKAGAAALSQPPPRPEHHFLPDGRGQGARASVDSPVDLLTAPRGTSPVGAQGPAGVAADLRIPEVVDLPNGGVSPFMPRAVR